MANNNILDLFKGTTDVMNRYVATYRFTSFLKIFFIVILIIGLMYFIEFITNKFIINNELDQQKQRNNEKMHKFYIVISVITFIFLMFKLLTTMYNLIISYCNPQYVYLIHLINLMK